MMPGTVRAHSTAVAGGAMSMPKTSRVPTTWKDATTARVTRARSAAWAQRGDSPRVWALRGSKARARKDRCPTSAMAATAASATARCTRSRGATASTSPNRNAVRSTAKDRECETTMTPIESMPTKSSPMLVSLDSRGERLSTVTPAAMAPAASTPPTKTLPPSREARATPGSMPCETASPKKAMPRSTTHVPASAQVSDTRTPPHRARWTKVTSKGPISAAMTDTLQ